MAEYDSNKMFMFNLLYCDGDETLAKLGILYDLVVESNKPQLKERKHNEEDIIKKLEYLILIPTLMMTNLIE